MSKKLILGIALLAVIIILGVNFGQYLTLENAQAQQAALSEYISQNFVTATLVYFFCLYCHYRILNSGSCSCYVTRCCFIWLLDQSSSCLFC